MKRKIADTIDDYVAHFPKGVQQRLKQLRATIRKAAPDAREKISYAIPTFTLGRNLVHFAAYERHIGFYPGAAGIAAFQQELSVYKSAKGSVQFPLNEPLPLALVTRIVKFRVEQESARAKKVRRRTPGSRKS